MNEQYFQSLVEGVKRRKGSKGVPIFHKDSPIGKYISKELHDEIVSTGSPFKHPKLSRIINDGIKRGKIGNTKSISYKFRPAYIKQGKGKKLVHNFGTEHGFHNYSFTTKSGRKVNVNVLHAPVRSKSKLVKGILNKSYITFDVDGEMEKSSDGSRDSTEIVRGVITSLRHHLRSHNPESIGFSASDQSRTDFYKYLVKKISNKYNSKITMEPNNPLGQFSKFDLENKRSLVRPEVQSTINNLIKNRKA